LHMVQLMPVHPKIPLSLASYKSKLVLPFWYWLNQVVLEQRQLNVMLHLLTVLIVVLIICGLLLSNLHHFSEFCCSGLTKIFIHVYTSLMCFLEYLMW